MRIEPTRTALQTLQIAVFHESATEACDLRANFSVMKDNVGPGETTACRAELIAPVPVLSPPPRHAAIQQADGQPSRSAVAYLA
jgi:hypothetical protein